MPLRGVKHIHTSALLVKIGLGALGEITDKKRKLFFNEAPQVTPCCLLPFPIQVFLWPKEFVSFSPEVPCTFAYLFSVSLKVLLAKAVPVTSCATL